MAERIKTKTSRFSFLGNYLLSLGLLFLIFILGVTSNPPIIILYFLLVIMFVIFFEPEGVILYTTYNLETDYVSEMRGFFVKRQTAIPYRNIADERLKKGIIGRIFDFGDIIISGPKTEIVMKGIKAPEKIYKEIEKKLTRYSVKEEK